MDGPVVSRPPERASSDAGELANEAWFEADVEEREKADDESADEVRDREDSGEDTSAAEDDVDEERDDEERVDEERVDKEGVDQDDNEAESTADMPYVASAVGAQATDKAKATVTAEASAPTSKVGTAPLAR